MRIVFFSVLIFLFSCVSKNNSQSIDIKDILTKNKSIWKIDSVETAKIHYFEPKISKCFNGLIKDTLDIPVTYLLHKNNLCICVIEEIKFNNTNTLNKAFEVLENEAENVRISARNKFGEVCFELRAGQFFYVIKKDNTIILFNDGNSYNYKYNGGADSVEAIIGRDQNNKNEIIFDDIYRFIKNK